MGTRFRQRMAAGLCFAAAAALLLAGRTSVSRGGACLADIDLKGYGVITVALDEEAAGDRGQLHLPGPGRLLRRIDHFPGR